MGRGFNGSKVRVNFLSLADQHIQSANIVYLGGPRMQMLQLGFITYFQSGHAEDLTYHHQGRCVTNIYDGSVTDKSLK